MPIHIDYDQVSVAFGKVLKAKRTERGIPSDEFARHTIGMDPAHYRGLENAVYAPSLYYLVKIAGGIGCEPEELVTEMRKHLDAIEQPSA